MDQPLAYLNGTWLPASHMAIPVTDAGFVQGVTVAEQLRTCGGRLFRWEQHVERLRQSLAIVGIDLPLSDAELAAVADRLVRHNHALLAAGDDLGLSMFVTPGTYAAFTATTGAGPTIGLHTYPIPFGLWARKYRTGQRLAVTSVRQVPDNCWPAALKCRSRMHYFLADRAAARQDAGARALILDQQGYVTEASTANLVVLRRDEGMISPPREKILPGVSVAALEELAAGLGIRFTCRDLQIADLLTADEVLLSSTSPCLLPVTHLDGAPIGAGTPGPGFAALIAAWSKSVGVDIVAQAERFATR